MTHSTQTASANRDGTPGLGACGVLLFLQIAALVVIQGGFYGIVPCLCGVISWPLFLSRALSSKTQRQALGIAALFLIVPLVYLVGLVVTGVNLYGATEAISWLGVVGMAFLATQLSGHQRERLFDATAIFGVAYAAIGLLCYVGLFSFQGAVVSNRLAFTFQYTNALAAFLAVACVLCLRSRYRVLKICAIVPALALIATMSGGAAAALAICACIGAIVWAARQGRFLQNVPRMLRAALAALAMIVVVCALLAIAYAIMPDRVSAAFRHLLFRLMQMKDGVVLMFTSPLVGIGPDRFQFTYPFSQTSQYQATVLHCSWLQIGLDGGILALLALAAGVIQSMRLLWRDFKDTEDRRQRIDSLAALGCVAFLAIHSLVDFDLQFGALAAILMICASSSISRPKPLQLPAAFTKARKPLAIGATSLACLVCIAGVASVVPLRQMQGDLAAGKNQAVMQAYEGMSLFRGDEKLQTLYLQAALGAQDYDKVDAFRQTNATASDTQAICTYKAIVHLWGTTEAADFLCNELERQPYNYSFYEQACDSLDSESLDSATKQRFDALIDAFDERAKAAQQAGLPNQRSVK